MKIRINKSNKSEDDLAEGLPFLLDLGLVLIFL